MPRIANRFRLPFDGTLVLTTDFGDPPPPGIGINPDLRHLGEDWAGAVGTPVLSVASGEVVEVGLYENPDVRPDSAFGKYVIVEHTLPDGTKVYSLYAHLNTVEVDVGDDVRIGEQIGTLGATGLGTGAHLHWEISYVNNFTTEGADGAFGYDSPSQISFGGDLENGNLTVDPSTFVEDNDTTQEVMNNFGPADFDNVPADKLPDHVADNVPFKSGAPDLDVFVANVSGAPNQILTNDGGGNFTAADAPGSSLDSVGVALGDLDGDGDLDAFVAIFNAPNQILTNDGDGNFTVVDAPGGSRFSRDVVLGDLDGDGDLDAFVANSGIPLEPNQILTNDGDGNFTAADAPGGFRASLSVALGDLDGDGDLDVYVANGMSQPDQILTNDGYGNFTAADAPGGSGSNIDIALGDLDGDGDLDVFIARAGTNQILTNDGDGNFTAAVAPGGSHTSFSVALGDLDGDGDLDVFIANRLAPNQILTNNGDGTFTAADAPGGIYGSYSRDVALGDLDGDGDLDVFIANRLAPNQILTNDGDGNFTAAVAPGGFRDSFSVALGDLDGDGGIPAVNEDGLPNLGDFLFA